jgi:hypothetical protein
MRHALTAAITTRGSNLPTARQVAYLLRQYHRRPVGDLWITSTTADAGEKKRPRRWLVAKIDVQATAAPF